MTQPIARMTGMVRPGRLRIGLAALPLALLLGGCVEKSPRGGYVSRPPQTWAEPDQPIFDLARAPATQPAPVADPKIIEEGEKATLIYTCHYARPEVMREAIEGLISPEGSAQASPALNAIVVADRKEVTRSILAVLKEIDRPTPQLLVEARVVEVTVDSDLEYEIRHALTVNSQGSFVQSSGVALKTPGATPQEDQGSLLNLRSWASDGKTLDTFVRLLLSKGKARILSSPNLLVSPGNDASIITGEEVPIQSTQIVSGSLSTSTQFKRVGIKLRVNLQQITSDTARLQINPEVSTVTRFTVGTDQVPSNPIVAIRTVESTLSMKDGEVLTVGGLLRDEDSENVRGIPGLMDVPYLGMLFQSKRHTTVRTQLIFFMRIHIIAEGKPHTSRLYKPGSGMDLLEDKSGLIVPDAPPAESVEEPKKQADQEKKP